MRKMNIFFIVIGIVAIFNSIPTGLSLLLSNRKCTTIGLTAIDDAECKKYYICVYDETGSLVSYDTSCPASMVFDPSVKNCVSSTNFVYKTTSTSTTTTPSTTTTTPSTTTTTPSTTTTTPSRTTTTPSTTTTSSTTITTTSTTTTTPCNGRFPQPGDSTCQCYTFCYTNGVTTISYILKCPNELIFDSTTQRCIRRPATSPCKPDINHDCTSK